MCRYTDLASRFCHLGARDPPPRRAYFVGCFIGPHLRRRFSILDRPLKYLNEDAAAERMLISLRG